MRPTILLVSLAASASLFACGGGSGPSGVESSKQLSTTTAEERVLLCDYWDSLFMGDVRIATSCPGTASSQTGGSRERCETIVAGFATCEATVEQYEICIDAAEADPCVVYDAAICPRALLDCF